MKINFKNIPILRLLSPQERNEFVKWCKLRDFKKGDFLFKAGEKRNNFYVILKGRVEISRDKEEVQGFHIFSEGDFLDESALLEPGSYHTLNAVAISQLQVFVLSYKDFQKLEQEKKEIVTKIIKYICLVMAERLYHADNKLVALYETGGLIGSSLDIEDVAEKILISILKVIRAKKAAFVLATSGSKVKIIASRGFKKTEDIKGRVVRLEDDKVLSKFKQDKVTLIYNYAGDLGLKDFEDSFLWSIDSFIITPIVAAGELKAMIALFDKEGDEFNINNKILLEAVAHQISASLLLREAAQEEKAKREIKRVYY